MKVMVTGASGFVGAALCDELVKTGYSVVGLVRTIRNPIPSVTYVEAELSDCSAFAHELAAVDCIIHLAGRAHVLDDKTESPLEAFRAVNRDLTLQLAASAIAAGVKRFIFVSSIGVNGNSSGSQAFTEKSIPNPHAAYAVSKYEAEEELRKLLRYSGMELVIIRPPLIYASDAPGNFARLLKVVAGGLPLPFGLVGNYRSLISRRNMVAFLTLCIEHPLAADELFLIADGQDVSTSEIIKLISSGMSKHSHIFPVPVALLRILLIFLGKASIYQQLCCSLQVDASKARSLLGWIPIETTSEGLYVAGCEYIAHRKRR